MRGYDIIGDVHGESELLEGLLESMGYRESLGAYRHEDRTAIFVGDLIDRGPEQVRVVRLVQSMVDASTAHVVLGNHEFNAIAYATPDGSGDFLRTHVGKKGRKNYEQHEEFLDQVGGEGSRLHHELIEWFTTLPLWLDKTTFRVVHACWHDPSIAALQRLGFDDGLGSDELIRASATKKTEAYESVDTILKGPEISLKGHPPFKDKDGHLRNKARLRWWDHDATTLDALAEIPPDALGEDDAPYPGLPDVEVTTGGEFLYDPHAVPVFFGHYWRIGSPHLAGTNTVCVDFSAARDDESLVGYRHDDGAPLDVERFVRFPA